MRDVINSGVIVGPRILACGQGITITGGHAHDISIEVDTEPELRKAVRGLLKRGADVVKLFGTGGNSTLSSNPRLAQYSTGEFRAVVEEAHRVGKRVTTHVHGTPGIKNAVAAGIDSIEHCLFLGPDGEIAYDHTVAGLIAERDIPVSLGLPVRWRTPSDELMAKLNPRQQSQRGMIRARIEALRKMREAGVQLIPSSDAGTPLTRVEDFAALLEFMVREIGMTVSEVIHSVSGRAARALDLRKDLGTLEAGKVADLVVVDGDLDNSMSALRRVEYVVRSGMVVVSDGRLAPPRTGT